MYVHYSLAVFSAHCFAIYIQILRIYVCLCLCSNYYIKVFLFCFLLFFFFFFWGGGGIGLSVIFVAFPDLHVLIVHVNPPSRILE